jgi:PAS domain S-box-containing protein
MELTSNFGKTEAFAEPQSLEEAQAILEQMARAVSHEQKRLSSSSASPSKERPPLKDTAARLPETQRTTAPSVWDKRTYQSLVETAPDALVIIDDRDRIVLVNTQTERLFGYRREELLGQLIELVVPEGFRVVQAERPARPIPPSSLHSQGAGLIGRRKDGAEFPIEISLSPLETAEGALLTGTVRDVTDRKRLETRYRTLVEGIPAVTFMASLEGGVSEIYVSPHIETMLGFTQEEWLGDPFLWFRQLHPDDRERWGEEFARTCSTGVHFRSEYRFIARDGRVVWVHGEARVVRDDFGRPLYLQGIAFNITENKEAEAALLRSSEELEQLVQERTEELVEANKRANAASHARGQFLANMSHEIRTPLNAIIGFADLLRKGAFRGPSERDAWLKTVHDSGKHLLDLINDILDLSKIDAGKLEIERIEFSPTLIMAELCSLMRPRAEAKGLHLEVEYDGPMPEKVNNDPTRLKQLLINLVGNSVKFTERGRITIRARLDVEWSAGPRLVFAVSDTGIGIPQDKQFKLFESFTQVDASTTRKYGGTGLGLAICKSLSEAMGGGIGLQSRVHQGTTFTFYIDAGPLDGVPMILDPTEIGISAQTDDQTQLLGLPYHILVVDDGETNRDLIQAMLTRRGASIECAENGRTAVDRALSTDFDLILMDIQMPEMDGYAATRALRLLGSKIPIVALTANAMKGDDKKCLEAGCSGYLAKPIQEEVLVGEIARLLTDDWYAPSRLKQRASFTRPIQPESNAEQSNAPVVSTLPDDPVFHEAIAKFVAHLKMRVNEMQAACGARKFDELARHAHWLKGAGGTAGFGDFTNLAIRLEEMAKTRNAEGCHAQLDRIGRVVERIRVEDPPGSP